MATEIQLDIFEEAAKDTTAQKIKAEDENYQTRKASIQREIASTEEALSDPDISWQDKKEYEGDLRQYERDLRDLETSHQNNLEKLYAKQK